MIFVLNVMVSWGNVGGSINIICDLRNEGLEQFLSKRESSIVAYESFEGNC